MREETLGRIVRFLGKLGYFEMINEPQKFDGFIQGLSVDQFSNLLNTFNAMLRNVPTAEKGVHEEDQSRMAVDDWVAPSGVVQQNVIGNLLNGIKQLPDNNDKAALLYYSLLDLHLYSDGNGRTARFFYNLISGDTNIMEDIDWYIHEEDNSSCYQGSFEELKGIANIESVNWYSSYTLPDEINKFSVMVDSSIFDKTIETFNSGQIGEYNCIPLPESVESSLSQKEVTDLNFILGDSSGCYSVGGMTMLVMAAKKGQLQEWVVKNDESTMKLREFGTEEEIQAREQRFVFNLGEKSRDLFSSWTADDCREAIKVGNHFKEAQLNNIINIFVNPNNYVFDSGKTFKAAILPDSENKQL